MMCARKTCGLLLMAALIVVAGCAPREEHSREPLEQALAWIGLKEADLARPLAYEEGYNLVARNPLVDQVAESPFVLHGWAENAGAAIQAGARQGLVRLFDNAAGQLAGLGAKEDRRQETTMTTGDLVASYRQLFEAYNLQLPDGFVQLIEAADFSEAFDRQLGDLLDALNTAASLRSRAVSDLSSEEIAFVLSRPDRFFYPVDDYFKFLTAATHPQKRVMEIARKVDLTQLQAAARHVLAALDRFKTYLRDSTEASADPGFFFRSDRPHHGLLLNLPSPLGAIVVLGTDDNLFEGSAALLVDLGGNDHYRGPVAVGHLVPGAVSVAVDVTGNDRYDRGEADFGQGFGVLGVGILLDLNGNDRYLARNLAQGCGIMGIGLLADLAGADEYRISLMGQGFGLFGGGTLVDISGDDRYLSAGLGQGVGSTLGWGLLTDSGGNDKYLIQRQWNRSARKVDKWSHGQGAGLSIRSFDWTRHLSLYGGTGFLSDGGGDDVYSADGGNCMGAAYFMSIGALVDDGGNDKYLPGGGYGLGFGVHLANGILVERAGNDYYAGGTLTGGAASDRSIAVLADYAGNDIYGPSEDWVRHEIDAKADKGDGDLTPSAREEQVQAGLADVSYGAAMKRKALGLLIDYRGDDTYYARDGGWGESLGGVMPPSQPHLWGHAAMLDLNGRDHYYKAGRDNDQHAVYYDHGVFWDRAQTFWEKDLPGRRALPVSVRAETENLEATTAIEHPGMTGVFRELYSTHPWRRFRAVGKLVEWGPDLLSDLIGVLKVSKVTEINRDLLEALTILSIEQIPQVEREPLAQLLDAKDPYVRRFAAAYLGWWQVSAAEPALIATLNDADSALRAIVLQALGRIGSQAALPVVAARALDDPSQEARRKAFETLVSIAGRIEFVGRPEMADQLIATLLQGLDTPDEVVRFHAATGLLLVNDRPQAIAALEKRLNDDSVYVRRAAARTLILSGVKAGLPVLIDSLQFPSIDTFEFYDNELVKDLALFTGIDFAADQRYKIATWRQWWLANGESVDLPHNLKILKKIEAAFAAPREIEGILIFDRLRAENPGNVVVVDRYKRFCREWITFRLLQREVITREIIERCIALQTILIALEPNDLTARSHLAYFQRRLKEME